ncbi:MAG: SDR family NAD(P)-dependent oxidoreductase, partial [Deltaproteobacteria bacterium]|nr:SDR family NAD(P)-dependent oxidoreductase [Deltaproteobacteria bacterium]
TGGAGDIVGKIVADLAANLGGTYYLADLTPIVDQNDPDVENLRNNPEELKLKLIERLRLSGERATPVLVDKALGQITRKAAVLDSLEAVRTSGVLATQLSFDVTDLTAVKTAVDKIIKTHGRLDYILHAAGLEHSQGLARKAPESFDRILGVKVNGLHALLAATRKVKLSGLMLFGSVAGRFGNAGQTDYSAANDLMSKCCANLKATRPDLQAFTLAFSGWGGSGMATRGSVPAAMQRAGITLIPLDEGASSVRRVFASAYSGELVVARSLGILMQKLKAAGVNTNLINQRLAQQAEQYPLLDKALAWNLADGLQLEISFDPDRDPYLNDHRIDGTVVVPGVMAVEAFAEAASLVQPEQSVVAVEDLAFESPLKLYRSEPRKACVRLIKSVDSQGVLFLASMETTRSLVGGREQTVRHYQAKVRLLQDSRPATIEPPLAESGQDIDRSDIYRAYFHGPSFQVLNKVTAGSDGKTAGWMQAGTETPALGRKGRMIAAPMFTELAFQAAGIVEVRENSKIGLPAGVRKLMIHQLPKQSTGQVAAWVIPNRTNGGHMYDVKVVDERGNILVELDGYKTSPLPNLLPEDVRKGLLPKGNKK